MGKKIAVLLENRFIEKEIIYYSKRFSEEGYEVVFLTRLWGQPNLTFKGLEFSMEFKVEHSFETMTEQDWKEYSAVIVPAGYVADYLLYAEKPKQLSPAVELMKGLMENKGITKCFICHSLWLAAPIANSFKGRKITCHNNIIAHAENAGMIYEDKTVVIDNDLITARTGDCFSELARAIVDKIKETA